MTESLSCCCSSVFISFSDAERGSTIQTFTPVTVRVSTELCLFYIHRLLKLLLCDSLGKKEK